MRPHDWEFYVKHQEERPEGWIEAEHGRFPSGGLKIFIATLPSANRSDMSPANDKHPLVAFGKNFYTIKSEVCLAKYLLSGER